MLLLPWSIVSLAGPGSDDGSDDVFVSITVTNVFVVGHVFVMIARVVLVPYCRSRGDTRRRLPRRRGAVWQLRFVAVDAPLHQYGQVVRLLLEAALVILSPFPDCCLTGRP